MRSFKIELAGIVVEIRANYPQTADLCSRYRTDKTADFCIEVKEQDVLREQERSDVEHLRCGNPPEKYPVDYLETLAVYRAIAERIPFFETVLIHGSALAMDDEGYLFVASSGGGKSTHTALWRRVFGGRVAMINDDKPLISCKAGVRVFGTPWMGKHGLGCPMSAELKGICFLHQSTENQISPLAKQDGYPLLLQHIYRPASAEAMKNTMHLAEEIAQNVPMFAMGCNLEPEAAIVAWNGMKGKDQ